MTTLRKACIKKGARKLTLNKYKLGAKKSQEKTWLFLRKNPSSIHSKPGISFPSVFSSSFSFASASLFSYFLYPIPPFSHLPQPFYILSLLYIISLLSSCIFHKFVFLSFGHCILLIIIQKLSINYFKYH